MWLKELKVAIIEKNSEKLSELMDELPQFKKQEDIKQAIHLLKQAKDLILTFQEETFISMKQMKKNINFLKVTQEKTSNKFDVIS